MSPTNAEVVIVGGGIVGVSAAYYLGQAGVRSVVVERDSVGSHASGFAYGGLDPVGGSELPASSFAVAIEAMRLHRELSEVLPDRTGVNFDYRERPTLVLAFTEEEAKTARKRLACQQAHEGYPARWVDPVEMRSIEPRISQAALGGVYTGGGADLEPHRFLVALIHAAEKLGAKMCRGRATSVMHDGDTVRGITLDHDEISCEQVILAMGPWCHEASGWLGLPVEVRPLKGQILRLRAPGPPVRPSIGWQGNYATTKPDGLVWAGTTEEEVGFDEKPTDEAREEIATALVKKLPFMAQAEVVRQTACLRPVTPDRLLLLGKVPNWEGAYIATGAGRQGIVLGPAMGQLIAELITTGKTGVPIEAFNPGRFAES